VLVPLAKKDYDRLKKAAERDHRKLGRQAEVYILKALDEGGY
jgi:threonyl-tRNA synthetase